MPGSVIDILVLEETAINVCFIGIPFLIDTHLRGYQSAVEGEDTQPVGSVGGIILVGVVLRAVVEERSRVIAVGEGGDIV